MRVYIADTDVTDICEVSACKVIDAGLGESDSLQVTFGVAKDFFKWKPRTGEKIRVTLDGYSSGDLPIVLEMPGDGEYTVLAAAMPESMTRRAWSAYEQTTIGDILNALVGEYTCMGINTDYAFKYAARFDESVPEFVTRLLTPQAGLCKWTSDGMYLANIEYLLARDAAGTIQLRSDGANFSYTAADTHVSTVNVVSPFGMGSATTGEESGGSLLITDAPVFSDMDALRWAQGALLKQCLGVQTLEVGLDFAPNVMSWGLYETTQPYDGLWLATRVEHDLKNKRTTVTLER